MRTNLQAVALVLASVMLAGAMVSPTGAQPQGAAPVKVDEHGDALPPGAMARLGTLRWSHGAPVFFVAYTADGKGILTASHDGTARVWDGATGKEIRRFGNTPGPTKGGAYRDHAKKMGGVVFACVRYNQFITSVALSPDRLTLAAGNGAGTVTLYEVATGTEITQIKTNVPDWVNGLVFARDGKCLLARVGHDKMLRQWDLANGKEIRKFGPADFSFGTVGSSASLAFSPDDKTLYAGASLLENQTYRPVVRRYEVDTRKELPPLKWPTGVFHALAFSPDGKHLVWGGNEDIDSLWDIAADKEVHRLVDGTQVYPPTAYAFSPDSKTVAARTRDQALQVWDVASGKEVRRLGVQSNQGALHYISSRAFLSGYARSNLAFSADGKRLAAGTAGNRVRQWELGTGKELGQVAGHHGAVLTLALSADGKLAYTRCYDNIMHVWNAASGKETRRFALPGIAYAAFTADGRTMTLGAGDGTLYTWNAQNGKASRQWKADQTRFGLYGLALSADGKTVASRDHETVSLWDASTGKELHRIAEGPVHGGLSSAVYESSALSMGSNMLFSPDGTLLATLSKDQEPHFARIRVHMRDKVGGSDSELRLWDVATGKRVRQFEVPPAGLSCFAFAPDGRTVAVGNYDQTISLLECASGKERARFKSSQVGMLGFLTFLPDGKTLIGAGYQDPTIRFWDRATGKELAQIKGHQSGITSLAVSADGKTLISGSLDTTALVYPTPAWENLPAPLIEIDAAKAEALWNDLAGADAKKAGAAIHELVAAPRQALALLRERFKPVAAPDPLRVAQLIADLDSDQFAVRMKATEELERLGELADDVIQKALAGQPSLETRKRLEQLRDRLVTNTPLPAETLRALRALEVLEEVGSPEARQVVEALTRGAPSARLTRAAQATLTRLVKR